MLAIARSFQQEAAALDSRRYFLTGKRDSSQPCQRSCCMRVRPTGQSVAPTFLAGSPARIVRTCTFRHRAMYLSDHVVGQTGQTPSACLMRRRAVGHMYGCYPFCSARELHAMCSWPASLACWSARTCQAGSRACGYSHCCAYPLRRAKFSTGMRAYVSPFSR